MTSKERLKKWKRLLPKLKARFEAIGIQSCEVCRSTFALSFAHRLKRRFIHSDEELSRVALLCQMHHEQLEHSGHEKMFKTITKIIKQRELING